MSSAEVAVSGVRHSTRPIRSMTGFALVRRASSAGELTVSLRSVNHRGLDLHFHLASELAIFENGMRKLLKEHVCRGHVEVRVSLDRDPASGPGASYNSDLLGHYIKCFRRACGEFGIASEPDLNTLFMLPGVLNLAPEPTALGEGFEAELMRTLSGCIHEVNVYRENEGQELCAGLHEQLQQIDGGVHELTRIRAHALREFHQELRDRLNELLGNSAMNETRLAEEAALLADRSDVQEELVRLGVHTEEVRRTFHAGGEIGKRLDFLMQEMNRETNTILSKTSGGGEAALAITNLALGIKANIEKIREQVLNLE